MYVYIYISIHIDVYVYIYIIWTNKYTIMSLCTIIQSIVKYIDHYTPAEFCFAISSEDIPRSLS